MTNKNNTSEWLEEWVTTPTETSSEEELHDVFEGNNDIQMDDIEYYLSSLNVDTLEANMRMIHNNITNNIVMNDNKKSYLYNALNRFYRRKRKEILKSFAEAKEYCDNEKLNLVTRFTSRFILQFLSETSVDREIYNFLLRTAQELGNAEYQLIMAHKYKRCPICNEYLGENYRIRCCGAMMIKSDYRYGCPNGD